MTRELRYYDYVNTPCDAVCAVLRRDALGVLTHATEAADERAASLGPELRARIAGITVGVPIAIRVGQIVETEAYGMPSTRFSLEWHGARRAWLFPTMTATLDVYPLSPRETQLDFQGVYDPPLGVLGDLGDALAAHRVAEASIQRFVQAVGTHLRQQLSMATT